MEKLSPESPNKLSGNRILRLMTIVPGDTLSDDERSAENTVSRDEVMDKFVLSSGLESSDTVIVDGRDALEALPRPDAFGNNRLALMAILDSMPHDSRMTLEIDKEITTEAAD